MREKRLVASAIAGKVVYFISYPKSPLVDKLRVTADRLEAINLTSKNAVLGAEGNMRDGRQVPITSF